jgi:hypothetical protein
VEQAQGRLQQVSQACLNKKHGMSMCIRPEHEHTHVHTSDCTRMDTNTHTHTHTHTHTQPRMTHTLSSWACQ